MTFGDCNYGEFKIPADGTIKGRIAGNPTKHSGNKVPKPQLFVLRA